MEYIQRALSVEGVPEGLQVNVLRLKQFSLILERYEAGTDQEKMFRASDISFLVNEVTNFSDVFGPDPIQGMRLKIRQFKILTRLFDLVPNDELP